MITYIQRLQSKILQAKNNYYNGEPTVDDAIYDLWVDELTKLDPENPVITGIGAPLPATTEWKKAKHLHPMNSLNKVQNETEFEEWAKECDNGSGFLVMDKLDGISLSTQWENGKLIAAITRGDSEIGEEISANVRKMKGVPKQLSENFTGFIRGEIVLLKSDHIKHFPEYENPRNAASGIAKRYDGKGSEHLTVIFYTVQGGSFQTESEQIKWLEEVDFNVPNYKYLNKTQDVLIEYQNYRTNLRDSLDWQIDGLVVRINDIGYQESLGEKAGRPKAQIAFKFPPETAETILRKIEWQAGYTGRISPVAVFDALHISGVKIERASLYNYSYIKDLELDIGSKVLVSRSNDVIPVLLQNIKSTGTIAPHPTICPECNTPTQFNGEYLICPNKSSCPAQVLGRLQAWINTQNILDWSDSTLQRTIDAGLVEDVADLYALTPEDLEPLERMGTKLAKKLIDILNSHRTITLQNFVGGLGINGIAASSVEMVMKAGYHSLEALKSLSVADLENINGFGSIKARMFYDGLKESETRMQDILNAGVEIKNMNGGKLSGLSFCFTGKAELGRTVLFQIVEENGGMVKKSVGKGLDYLVMADPESASTKTQAAKKNGVKIISEKEFLEMVDD